MWVGGAGVERLLRNTALRKVAQALPWKAMGNITDSEAFRNFAYKALSDADLDGDGRCASGQLVIQPWTGLWVAQRWPSTGSG